LNKTSCSESLPILWIKWKDDPEVTGLGFRKESSALESRKKS